jgi:diacylglycerol O-acyltransferase / wax synthase
METSHQREYLSFGDALFLHLERPGIPINIASVAVFDGIIPLDEFLPYVEAKLSQVPRCMQRVVPPPFNIGLPWLEYDPDFDFRNHVHDVTLKTGTEAELKRLTGKFLSQNLDRDRPLWHFVLVHGLKGNRTALIARIHHSMADGMSGVAFLNALMDTSPEVPAFARKKPQVPRTPPRDPATTLIDALTSSCFLTVQRFLDAQSNLLAMARQVINTQAAKNGDAPPTPPPLPHVTPPSMEDLSQILPEIASAPQPLPFNVICQGPQKFEWTDVPFEDLRAMKNADGCSFNDVTLAVICATYRKYAEHRGASVTGRSLRVVVPVNTRPPHDDRQGMGNEITFVPVSVPLDIRDPKKLIAAAHDRMTMIKQAKIAEMVTMAGALISAIPSALQMVLGQLAPQLPLLLCNLIFTNVPGPRTPLYILGHRMLKAYPYVPIGGEMGANCALLTYDGVAHFGFSCDVHATPDPHILPQLLQETIAEFKQAFGLSKEKRRRVRRPATPKARVVKAPPDAEVVVPQPVAEPERAFAAASD